MIRISFMRHFKNKDDTLVSRLNRFFNNCDMTNAATSIEVALVFQSVNLQTRFDIPTNNQKYPITCYHKKSFMTNCMLLVIKNKFFDWISCFVFIEFSIRLKTYH